MLPPEILVRIAEMDGEMGGLTPDTYHLDKGEKINEAINRSWNRLLGVWATFRKAREVLPQEDLGTSVTREKWLLKLFDELGYGRLLPSKPIEVDEKIYPVSHFWQHTPIHLIGFRVDLDKSLAHSTGTYRSKPHSMVQEFLNRTEAHLWAFLSNGLQLRILRDNTSLVRQAYVEFDLEAMMDGGIFPDFKLLWLLCHQSRVEADRPEDCWLEIWTRVTQVVGTRAREDLRKGVQRAIEALGAGFLAHPANDLLRDDLRAGRLDKQNYYRELLRFVYQLIFLFVAEDRDLLAPPSTTSEAKSRYIRYYSTTRLRVLAGRKAGTRHDDLYRVNRLVIDSLGEGEGRKELGIPILNSSLFSTSATPLLRISMISNMDYLEAIRALAITSDRHGPRPINFRNLGSEELGSVYESLLELHPDVNIEAKTFSLKVTAGNERKTTGSYYTPTSLISCLLDNALDPVLDEACKKENPAQAILDLRVCDPACGSGHFLVAGAHRMAGRLASVRIGGDEPPPEAYRQALRDVIGRCIYGVDLNPMAVELCKVSLWMEALEPGKPLSFLDHQIRVGNSLLGATPELITAGLPDDAFTAIKGDDKKACAELKKRNKAERAGLGPLFAQEDAATQARLQQAVVALAELPDDRPEEVRAKELAFRRHEETNDYLSKKHLADAWCVAFVGRKHFREPGRESSASGLTQGHLNDLAGGKPLPAELAAEVEHLSRQHQFFHWHLAFPEVFANGGFSSVVANPPWGASVQEEVRSLIRARMSSVRRGTLDTFAAFTEQSCYIVRTGGRVGLVLPDILLLKNYPDLRYHLLVHTTIEQIAHWGQAFPDANIDVCTLAARIGEPPPDHSIDCIPDVEGCNPNTSLHHRIRQDVFVSNKDYRFNLRLSPETQDLIEAIKRLGPRVGDLFIIREGVHSGNVREKLFLAHADGEHCRPLIFGRDEIQPMQLKWAGKYIQLDPNRFNREGGDYFNLGNPVLYSQPKILVRRTGDFILAAPDLEGRFCSNNFFIVVPRSAMPMHQLLYAAAALNSDLATLYFRTIQPRTGKLFAELKITHLEDIPVPFFGDARADEEGRRLLSTSEGNESEPSPLNAFYDSLFVRIQDVAPQVASALQAANA
jgi:hypothetical protein